MSSAVIPRAIDHITMPEVVELIRQDHALTSLRDSLHGRLTDGDAAHALDHLLRVAVWVVRLSGGEPTVPLGIATALLHDAVNARKDSPERVSASARSAELAARVLPTLGFPADLVILARDAIGTHSRCLNLRPLTAFGCAFQDADRLDSLGVVALARSLTTGGQMGQEILCWADPWAEHRPLAPTRYTVDHILADLLPLPATLHMPRARAEGRCRVATMVRFLAAWGAEMGVPLPARIGRGPVATREWR